jgi:hypothetical protein
VPYKDDSQLDMYDRYTFKGYATSASSSKIVDLSKDIATRPTEFWAVFEEESVYDSITNKMYFVFTDNLEIPGTSLISLNQDYQLKGKITLPATDLYKRPISGIAEEGFRPGDGYNHEITHIFWEDSADLNVKTFGANSFRGSQSLKYIEIPQTTTIVGAYAFESCSNLEIEYLFDKSMVDINSNAFASNTMNNTTIILGSTVRLVGDRAFANPKGDMTVQLLQFGGPGDFSQLANYVFYDTAFRNAYVKSVVVYCTPEDQQSFENLFNRIKSSSAAPREFADPQYINA